MWQYDLDKDKPWLAVVWAGYNDNGNDRHGHMHVNPRGNFIRNDGLVGDYCAAPIRMVDGHDICNDPPYYKREDMYKCTHCSGHIFLADDKTWSHAENTGCDDPHVSSITTSQDWELRVMLDEIREIS